MPANNVSEPHAGRVALVTGTTAAPSTRRPNSTPAYYLGPPAALWATAMNRHYQRTAREHRTTGEHTDGRPVALPPAPAPVRAARQHGMTPAITTTPRGRHHRGQTASGTVWLTAQPTP